MSAKDVTIFTEKNPNWLFIFKMNQTKPNCIVCIDERQPLKIIPQICLIFSFKVLGLPFVLAAPFPDHCLHLP